MLLDRATLEAIHAGRISQVFRRWKRATVRAGGQRRTALGVLDIVACETLRDDEVTDAQARAAGYPDRATLLKHLAGRDGTLHRLELRFAGPDPRVALRSRPLRDDEVADVQGKLARLDRASRTGPWTLETLKLIGSAAGTRAADLAERQRFETPVFKRRVRQLKELGLTESLEVGYRLSPRGESLLRAAC